MKYSNYNGFNTVKSVQKPTSVLEDAMELDRIRAVEEGYIELNEWVSLNEAEYSFLPKFRKDRNLKEFEKEAKDAEELLNDEGINPKTGAQRCFKLILRILDILDNIGSVCTLVGCITIVGIIPHLLQRGLVWLEQEGQEALAVSQGEKIYRELINLAKNEKDSKKKKVYEEKAEKIKEMYKKVDRNRNI